MRSTTAVALGGPLAMVVLLGRLSSSHSRWLLVLIGCVGEIRGGGSNAPVPELVLLATVVVRFGAKPGKKRFVSNGLTTQEKNGFPSPFLFLCGARNQKKKKKEDQLSTRSAAAATASATHK
jgi:hypothetical protein